MASKRVTSLVKDGHMVQTSVPREIVALKSQGYVVQADKPATKPETKK